MKVSELIEILQKYPQDTIVITPMYSDFTIVETSNIFQIQLPIPRKDGWVESWRPDKPTNSYVCIGY
jgi:hypothetical protein